MYLSGIFILSLSLLGFGLSQDCSVTGPCSSCALGFVRDQTDCTLFYMCFGGKSYRGKCREGTVFSFAETHCVDLGSEKDDCDVESTKTTQTPDIVPSPTQGSTDIEFEPSSTQGESPGVAETDGATSVTTATEVETSDTTPTTAVTSTTVPTPVQTSSCGLVISPLIVNPEQTFAGQWPWMGSLRLRDFGSWTHHCGASLIFEQWAVTAAHCVRGLSPSQIRVSFGIHVIGGENPSEQTRDVSEIIIHPFSESSTFVILYDVALLKFNEPVDVNAIGVSTICLPSLTDNFMRDESCTIIGWGDTEGTGDDSVLNQATVDLINCSETRWVFPQVQEQHICQTITPGGPCRADSGGPLMCMRNGRYMLAGITSFGHELCQSTTHSSVYTRIVFLLQWITDTMSVN